MLIVVDPNSGVPVFRQLMDQIKFHIASGLLEPGSELPSTRALSAELGVNPMTISKAYGYLEKEGVVEHPPGRRVIVKALDDDQMTSKKVDQLRSSLTDTIRMVKQMGIGEDDIRAMTVDAPRRFLSGED